MKSYQTFVISRADPIDHADVLLAEARKLALLRAGAGHGGQGRLQHRAADVQGRSLLCLV